MIQGLLYTTTVRLLFSMPCEGTIERHDCLNALEAWHEERYERFNEAQDILVENGFIRTMHHGSGMTYRLTEKGKSAIDLIIKTINAV